MKRKTTISSIFGQIEGVVALAMAAEKKINLIPADQIPPTVLYNDAGTKAICAVVMTSENEREFNERVKNLRA